MQEPEESLTAGIKTQYSCSTAGAKPVPQINWNKASIVIRGATQTVYNERIP